MNIQITVILLAVAATGCSKKYGVGCKKEVEMTAPWTELGLPIGDDTRVCESGSDMLKLRSYAWTKEDEAQKAFAAALDARGYQKDRCTQQACWYDKDGWRVSVQPMDFKVKKKKLVTVVLRRRKLAGR